MCFQIIILSVRQSCLTVCDPHELYTYQGGSIIPKCISNLALQKLAFSPHVACSRYLNTTQEHTYSKDPVGLFIKRLEGLPSCRVSGGSLC